MFQCWFNSGSILGSILGLTFGSEEATFLDIFGSKIDFLTNFDVKDRVFDVKVSTKC